jgi:hypothetical protein
MVGLLEVSPEQRVPEFDESMRGLFAGSPNTNVDDSKENELLGLLFGLTDGECSNGCFCGAVKLKSLLNRSRFLHTLVTHVVALAAVSTKVGEGGLLLAKALSSSSMSSILLRSKACRWSDCACVFIVMGRGVADDKHKCSRAIKSGKEGVILSCVFSLANMPDRCMKEEWKASRGPCWYS